METRSAWPRPNWLWRPSLMVFLSSACIMVLELALGRVVAPHVGMSLYTWTVVISLVLAGITLGNYLGGRLADRWASARLLGGIFIVAGLTSLGILVVDVVDRLAALVTTPPVDVPRIAGIAVYGIVMCLPPCIVLGMVSPVVAKIAVRDLNVAGRTIGRIYAAGAAGSIVGTFATGFLLISWLGTHVVVWTVGALLFSVGLVFLFGRRWLLSVLSLVFLIGGSALVYGRSWLDGPCTRETNYYCVKVREEEKGGTPVRVLILDRLVHSYSSLDDPTKLVYGYEQSYAQVTAYQAARKEQIRALFVGGGAYTFPRYMEAVYPDSELDVIEIDPGVTEVAHDMLGLRRNTRVVTFNEDARVFLDREPNGSYDLIFGDAFNDYSVPYHLTTKEFNDRVRAWLTEDGIYVVNIIDGPWGYFVRAFTHTLRQTFRHVYPAFSVSAWRESPRVTIVILASDSPLDLDAFQAAAPKLAAKLLAEHEVDALLAEGRTVTLTDRYAPVDQMLLPVFLEQVPK
jgi:spermidine synthase